ncbi:MAG: DUF5320 domain-containing protein [Flavobacterium sp.]|nr:DUF5320 domain-containing protein [Flavobacterium sp.]
MKTKYILTGAFPQFSLLTILTFLIASCSSQRSYQDQDGIYGSSSDRQVVQQTASNELYYKDYFGSFTDDSEEAEIFTDVENYRTENDSSVQYATGNPGWGNDNDNITINVYDNNWGYGMWNNYWYGGWGWNTGWGWNSWYGPSYGWGWNSWYGPGWGMGWNNWYGPNYGWAGYGHYYPNHYSHNSGIRGVRNDMYGRSARNTSDRTYTTGRRVNPNYSNTRNSTYSGTRNQNATSTRNTVRTRTTTGNRNPNYNTTTTRPQTQSPTRNNTYTPTRSSTPSSGTVRPSGGGGRSSGGSVGGGGGRSSGGGGRR